MMGKGKLWIGLVVLFGFAVSSLTFVGCQKKKPEGDKKVVQAGKDKDKDKTPKPRKETPPKEKVKPKKGSGTPAKGKEKEKEKEKGKKIPPDKKEPVKSKEDAQKEIVKLFDDAKTLAAKKEYSKLADLMTKESQQAVAGLLLAESVFLKQRAENPKIAKAYPKLVKEYQPVAKALAVHKIGDAFFGKASDVKELYAEWRNKGISKEQADMAKKKFIDLTAMADIKNPSKFIADYLKARPKQTFTAEAKLTDVKINGDRATATVQEGTIAMPVAFRKVGDEWRVQVTPNILNALLRNKEATAKEGES